MKTKNKTKLFLNLEDINKPKIEITKIKKVTKQMWKKMGDEERFNALLSIIKDPSEIGPQIEDEWEDLQGWMQRDMTIKN